MARCISTAVEKRSFGSLESALSTTASNSGGVDGTIWCSGTASRSAMFSIVFASVSPRNGCSPVVST